MRSALFFAALAAASAPVLSAVPSSIMVSEGDSSVLYVRELEDEALRGVAPSADMYEVLAARQNQNQNQNQNNNNQNSTSSPGSSSQVGSFSQPQSSSSSRNDRSSSIASSVQWTTSSVERSSSQDTMSWTSQISSQPQWTSSESSSRQQPTSSFEFSTSSASPSSDSFSSAVPSSTRAAQSSSEASQSPSVTASSTSADQSSSASASVVVVTLTQTGTDGSQLIKSTMTSTSPGSLATGKDDSSHGSGGGLSSHDKQIVIGVCVGVGGFLLLLGVAFVVWRIWFKKPRYSPSPVSDVSGQTEFKSNSFDDNNDVFRQNIDQYHAPRSNAATNF